MATATLTAASCSLGVGGTSSAAMCCSFGMGASAAAAGSACASGFRTAVEAVEAVEVVHPIVLQEVRSGGVGAVCGLEKETISSRRNAATHNILSSAP